MKALRAKLRAGAFAVVPALLLAVVVTPAVAQELPQPAGFVNDFAGVIDARDEQRMTALAEAVQEATGAEIAVAVVDSIEPFATVEEYSIRLASAWGVGSAEDESGVLMVLALQERQVRIEVGYGIEGAIPDGRAGEILDTAVVPELREDNYGAGLYAGMQQVAGIIAEEYDVDLREHGAEAPVARSDRGTSSGGGGGRLLYMLLLMFFLGGGRFFWPLLFLTGGRGFFGGGFGSGGGGGGFGGFGGGGFGGGGASRGF
ncbi:MAG: TPM domain-containing protein [Spirochaetaceae bacterium]